MFDWVLHTPLKYYILWLHQYQQYQKLNDIIIVEFPLKSQSKILDLLERSSVIVIILIITVNIDRSFFSRYFSWFQKLLWIESEKRFMWCVSLFRFLGTLYIRWLPDYLLTYLTWPISSTLGHFVFQLLSPYFYSDFQYSFVPNCGVGGRG